MCRYTVEEIERVVRLAAALALGRRRKLTSIDKANVLETSRLWRAVVERIMPGEFPDVSFEHMLVDSAAMHLLKRPRDFDVIVTENMFGDILTDEASMLAGSLGLLPSASLGAAGARRPVRAHPRSAPDIAGRGIANPYAAILSAALLLRYSLQLETEARAVEAAVSRRRRLRRAAGRSRARGHPGLRRVPPQMRCWLGFSGSAPGPRQRSATRSAASSIPTDTRSSPGPMPACNRADSSMPA